jgi:tetratricopeptide (TPR) repeat protein
MSQLSDLQERAIAARNAGRLDEAEACYRHLIALHAQHPGLYNNLGLTLVAQRRYAEAVPLFEHSLRLRPRHLNTLVALSNALNFSNRPEEAIARCEEILAIDTRHADARHNKAVALRAMNRHREAIVELAALLAEDPADADAEFNLALSAFSIGDYASASRHYEARWRGTKSQPPLPLPEIPLWQPGEDLHDARVLVQAEQGLGDTLQFIRFVPRLAQRCATVHVQVQLPLVDFLQRQLSRQHVGALGETVPAEIPQRRIALLSLPLAMQLADESDLASNGAYLHVDPARAAAWRGSPGHRNDHNRSLPVQTLAPWLDAVDATGVAVIALQKDATSEERDWLRRYANVHVLGDTLTDFDDTAAVLDSLDHVVAVDTSVAHLAGGMARPATILLPFSPDWRWRIDRDTSVFYPGVRLLRQRAIGDWSGAIQELIVSAERWERTPAR